MSRTDPMITIDCDGDKCQDSITLGLTPLSRRSYDERNIGGQLRQDGWVCREERDYCRECASALELT